jgi:hypothetical protein
VPTENRTPTLAEVHPRGDPCAEETEVMRLFKRVFGHERSESGKSLDRLVLALILIGVAIAVYTCHG